ncbi:cytochrome P450 3A9-like [Ptychodera flava]|uniref:cytochrome P450 3A9-like n=1 Tax=Ptychodera flava TaxID=63121 RepID=UPI00396A5C23
MDILGLSLTWWLIILSVQLFYVYGTWTFSTFSSQGIPGPKPLPLVGSFLSLMKDFPQRLLDYNQEYGRVYGFYSGRRPILVVSDVDMLKQIMVKQFNHFNIRKKTVIKTEPLTSAISSLSGAAWKYTRNVLTPAFSGAKMRQMSKTINGCADTMVDNLQKKVDEGADVDMKTTFGCFSMDCIARTAFGLEVDSQNNPDDPFVTNIKNVFNFNLLNPAILLLILFPSSHRLLEMFNFNIFPKKTIEFFSEVTEQAMKFRQSETEDTKHVDFLQLMMNAHKENDALELPDDEQLADKDIGYFKERGFTNQEILSNAFLFFTAGYETTSSCLACSAYLLAVNPDAQDKLIAEIDSVMESCDNLSYTALQEMPYLDMVISEVLWIYPPAIKTDRTCTESCIIRVCTYQGHACDDTDICHTHGPYTLARSRKIHTRKVHQGGKGKA